ncbi:hypothetical protein HK104_001799 [Borealophlyctis nickersoniae]|nr:hypothetical protein HK104_001799 [Borealophlyctis nickersoniae]
MTSIDPTTPTATTSNPPLATDTDKPSFAQGRTDATVSHALYEKVAGTVESTMGSLTGNKDAKIEGQARTSTASYEMQAAKGNPVTRN